MLQAALNGPFPKADHPAVPIDAPELADDARSFAAAGARSVHLHPRDASGAERADAEVVDEVVRQVRAAGRLEVSVTSGAWIQPDLDRRLDSIHRWREPDAATVNMSDEGTSAVTEALLAADVGIEAGIWTVAAAERLAESGLGARVRRVVIEPVDVRAADAVGLVSEIHDALDDLGLREPRLQHGDGEATSILIRDAIAPGIATRVGLEDTFFEPDGVRITGAALAEAARALGAGADADARDHPPNDQ
jgi:uncharacterized protein (DUF849 family)